MKFIRTKLTALAIAFCMALSLTGCGVNISSASLDSLPTTMERGSSLVATPEFAYDGETPESAKIDELISKLKLSYTSSNPDAIIIDENGNIAAVGIGTSEVAMSSEDGKITASKVIEVVVSPTSISMVDELTLSMDNNVAEVNPTVEPADATHVSIVLTSSDESIVTTDSENMEIHAVAEGEVVVTASIEGTDIKTECKVTVLPSVETVTLNKTSLSLTPKGTDTLTYTIAPENADASKVSWTSSDESIATIDENGNVTAIADGSATITVKVGNVESHCDVTVAIKKASTNKSGSGSGSSGSQTSSGSSLSGSDSSGSSGYTNTFDSDAASAGTFQTGALPLSHSDGTGTWWGIDSTDDAYWAVVNNINQMRRAVGLNELTCTAELSAIADSRCSEMVAVGDFSHSGARTKGEILARTQYTAAGACEAWRTSPDHYAVITHEGITQMGVACWFASTNDGTGNYGTLWCVVFE